MPAADATATPPRSRSHWRTLAYLLAAPVMVVLGLVVWCDFLVRAALPQLDGVIRVPGISAPVRVIRGDHGVPAIEASSLEDLIFAQGYVTAQDRLWQMDIMRRFAAGEMAEILGPDLIDHDREQRILGIRGAAEKSVALASPEI